MTQFLNSIYESLLKGIRFLVIILAIGLVLVVFSNVVCRYFLNFALAWAEETARFLFIWLSFLGAVLANAYSGHMNFDLLIKKMPKKVGEVFLIIAYSVILAILFLTIQGGITMVLGNWEWMTPALEISYGLVYSIAPICLIILALQFFTRLLRTLRSLMGFAGDKGGIE